MTRLFLVRHAEPSGAWFEGPSDPGLSRFGRSQADQCAQRLLDLGRLKIISSPTLRAKETAEPAANLQRDKVVIDPRIAEPPIPAGIPSIEDWLAVNFSEVASAKWSEAQPPVRAWREQVLAAARGITADTALFTHFAVINAIMCFALDVDDAVICRPDYASITEMLVEGNDIRLMHKGATPIGESRPG